jgi:hypothetical protein
MYKAASWVTMAQINTYSGILALKAPYMPATLRLTNGMFSTKALVPNSFKKMTISRIYTSFLITSKLPLTINMRI